MSGMSLLDEAVGLVKKTGSAIGEHLIYSNNGLEKLPTGRMGRMSKARDGFESAIKGATSEKELAEIVATHTPSQFRSKEGKMAWGKLSDNDRITMIRGQYEDSMMAQNELKQAYSMMNGNVGDTFNKMRGQYEGQYPEKNTLNSLKSGAMAGGDLAQHYFLGGGAKSSAIRIGTAAAGYGAVSGTARYISGGSMGYNSRGEKDIAGIPFV